MADHQYAATGFGGNGLTFGTLSGMMVSDAIRGRRNPWTELFDPGRAAIRHGLWDYIKENTDYPYYMVRDRFAGAEGKSLRSVKRGQGQDHRAQRRQDRRLSRCARRGHVAVGDLHAHGLHRRLESGGADMGLPVPRVTVHAEGRRDLGSCRIAAARARAAQVASGTPAPFGNLNRQCSSVGRVWRPRSVCVCG